MCSAKAWRAPLRSVSESTKSFIIVISGASHENHGKLRLLLSVRVNSITPPKQSSIGYITVDQLSDLTVIARGSGTRGECYHCGESCHICGR